jgi:hypothetical protein
MKPTILSPWKTIILKIGLCLTIVGVSIWIYDIGGVMHGYNQGHKDGVLEKYPAVTCH